MTYVGPNGRIYRKRSSRWPVFAVVAAMLMIAGVTVNALKPNQTIAGTISPK